MNKTTLFSMTAIALASSVSFGVSAADDATVNDRISQAEQRLQYLEKRIQDQNTAIASKQTEGSHWTDTIEVSGLIEIEAGASDTESGDSTSDVTVATVELGIAANINEDLSAEIVLLYEEDETDLEVDVAEVVYALPGSDWSFVAGQNYLPFGAFETALVSDPLTLELAETRETALLLSYEKDALSGSFYVFNGNKNDSSDNAINNFGGNIAYNAETFSLGLGYISDIGDSDTIQDVVTSSTSNDQVGAFSFNASIVSGRATFIFETIEAIESFAPAVLADAEPEARNIEVDYEITIAGKPAVLAIASQTTKDARSLSQPENRRLIGLGIDVNDNLSFSFEIAQEEDYDGVDTDTYVAQMAVSF